MFLYYLEKNMADKKVEQRLLPSDYTKLRNTQKDTRQPRSSGFFTFPEDVVGIQNIGDRKFLVFYFDNDEDYDFVKTLLEKTGSKTRSHPDLNSRKLVRLLHRGEKRHA